MAKKNQAKKATPQTTPTPPRKTTATAPKATVRAAQKPVNWGIGAVLALTFVAYLPTFDNSFVNWDDDVNILKNPQLASITLSNFLDIFAYNIIGNYNPLPIVTFFIEKAIVGDFSDNLARLIHTDNLLLHLLCVWLVYQLARTMNLSNWAALGVALLFGIHPMRVESVAWATERKDVLFAAFYFAALWQYAKYLKTNPLENFSFRNRLIRHVAVLSVFALFSKVQAVSLPLSMLALDYYFRREIAIKLIAEKWFFWLGSLAMGVTNVLLLKKVNSINSDFVLFNFFDRVCIASYSYCVYIIKCVYPYIMAAMYPYPSALSVWHRLALVAVAATMFLLWWAYRKDWRTLVFGIVFFTVNFIFVSQIVGAGQGYLADRFTYVPYFGFFVLIMTALSTLRSRYATLVNVAAVAFGLLFFVQTWQQIPTWKNGETLWTQVLNYEKSATTPYQNRGIYLRDQKRFAPAIADLERADSIAKGKNTAVLNSLGKTYFDSGDDKRALDRYNRALAQYTDLDKLKKADRLTVAEIFANRASANGRSGALDAALSDANASVRLDSTAANTYSVRSLIFQSQGKLNEALTDNLAYLRYEPNKSEYQYETGRLLRALQRDEEAIPYFDKAIALEQKGIYYLERARSHYTTGNKIAARQDAQLAQKNGANADAQLLQ